jgi:MFS family permease
VRFGAKRMLVTACAFACVALAGLAGFHSQQWALYCWLTLLYLGVVFSFGALPILILEVVPARQRGESTSMNLVFRMIGTGIGLQVAAAIVTSSETSSSGLPTELAYICAYGLWASVAAVALLLALTLPGRRKSSVAALAPSRFEAHAAPQREGGGG